LGGYQRRQADSSSFAVYADWCGPCKQIAPLYEQLSAQLSNPNKITFTKINVDRQTELSQAYGITAMPTFMVFKNARAVQTIKGNTEYKKFSEVVKKLANEANAVDNAGAGGFGEASSSGIMWLGAALSRGYRDVTDQVDIKGLELLNCDAAFGSVRTLFDGQKPSALDSGSRKGEHAGNCDPWLLD
jgi:thioredoxin